MFIHTINITILIYCTILVSGETFGNNFVGLGGSCKRLHQYVWWRILLQMPTISVCESGGQCTSQRLWRQKVRNVLHRRPSWIRKTSNTRVFQYRYILYILLKIFDNTCWISLLTDSASSSLIWHCDNATPTYCLFTDHTALVI